MGSIDLKEMVLVKSVSSLSEICLTLSSCNGEKFYLSSMV